MAYIGVHYNILSTLAYVWNVPNKKSFKNLIEYSMRDSGINLAERTKERSRERGRKKGRK